MTQAKVYKKDRGLSQAPSVLCLTEMYTYCKIRIILKHFNFVQHVFCLRGTTI